MKKQVEASILRDMERYIDGIDLGEYEKTNSTTNESVIEFVRDYYDKHLPVDLNAWFLVNKHNQLLLYRRELSKQIYFIRDDLCNLLLNDYESWRDNPIMVVSSYYSKSVKLPVFQLNLKEYGMEIILSCNFDYWNISINSSFPIETDFVRYFSRLENISYDEFPKDKVYGSYGQNNKQFSLSLASDYDLYTFFFLLKNYLNI